MVESYIYIYSTLIEKEKGGHFGIFNGGEESHKLANRDLDKYKLGRKLKKKTN